MSARPVRLWSAPCLAGALALGVYYATLAPGITWANAGTDGGDLVTAAAVWGVPHPPGYPTYTLLGHVFASLPFGDAAFNLNLMSAMCAALAAALIAASVLREATAPSRAGQWAAVIAGLTLAWGPMLWGQATIAEVHALNALFVAAIGFLAPPWRDTPRPLRTGEKIGLGLVWGLGLGNSPTIAAMAPIALPALWSGVQRRWAGFAALLAGLCVYALVPIRAGAQPAINWGDATTVPNFAWLVSGGLYRGYVLSAPFDWVARRLLSLPRLWLEQVGWVGAVWIGCGIRARPAQKGHLGAALAALLYVAFATTYATTDSDLYLIPVWALSAGYLGAGLAIVLGNTKHPARRVVIGAAASIAVAAMLIGQWGQLDLSDDRPAAGFANRVLSSLPPNAILVTHADAHTFTLWYYRLVAGLRKDVSIVDARLAGYAWYEAMLAAQGVPTALPGDRSESSLATLLVASNPARPVCDLPIPPRLGDEPILRCE